MKIGFIGLGNMGAPMAKNLAVAGHEVTGFDLVAACPKGVASAKSAEETAAGQEVVITMLPNGEILRQVADQILPAMAKGSILIDCSTVDVQSARDVAALAQERGISAIDAPVSGGITGAAAGTLTFMVGGPKDAFATVTPLFDVMGQKAVLCGPSGTGQAAKICNNMILGVTMIATCEAFALADKIGLDRQKMFASLFLTLGAMRWFCREGRRGRRKHAAMPRASRRRNHPPIRGRPERPRFLPRGPIYSIGEKSGFIRWRNQ